VNLSRPSISASKRPRPKSLVGAVGHRDGVSAALFNTGNKMLPKGEFLACRRARGGYHALRLAIRRSALDKRARQNRQRSPLQSGRWGTVQHHVPR
jgi:hypothetical protein